MKLTTGKHPTSHIPHPTSRLTPHLPLLVILILFTALTLYQSVLLPLGEADDETDHYQYLRFVARTGHPPLTEAQRREAGFKGGLAPFYYWLTAWPIAIIGPDTPPDIRRVDARPERHIPTDGLGINHVQHTLDEQWPWRGQPLAWHLVRLLSLPMAWVTIIATYLLARRLVPHPKIVAIGAAAFVAFLPRFVISSAVINDDNLVFALTALLLLVQVHILQSDHPPSAKIMAAFGALFGLTLVTKYFSLILIPEIIFTLWVTGRRVASRKVAGSQVASHKIERNTQHASRIPAPGASVTPHSSLLTPHSSLLTPHSSLLTHCLPFLAALFLTAGPWFIFIAVRFNRIGELGLIPGLAASLGEPQITEGLVGLLSGQSVRPVAATYSLPQWAGLLYRSFWFEYGWMRLFAPTWIYALFTIFALLALIGLIQKIRVYGSGFRVQGSGFSVWGLGFVRHATRNTQHVIRNTPLPIQLLVLHLLLFVIVLIARYTLSATIDTGQGRHLYPALPVIALLVSLGLTTFARQLSSLPSPLGHLPPATCHLLLATCYLLPALISLQPAAFILPRYHTLPVTTAPAPIPADRRQALEFADGLSLTGYHSPDTAAAGNTLPVTLYWRAQKEAQQDYLVSLCLRDTQNRPVACWRGHFANGRYPARAWQPGDTLIDTVHIPIPTCYRISEARYTLHLELWPLDPTSAVPQPEGSPVLEHTFDQPQIRIRATGSLKTRPQTVDLWQANQRVTQPAQLELNQTLTQISYATAQANASPKFEKAANPPVTWQPLTQFNTPLYLPCNDGPTPFAHLSHFIVDPTLAGGNYHTKTEADLPPVTLSLRNRTFAPRTQPLTFNHMLAPLSLQLPATDTTIQPAATMTIPLISNLQSPISNYQLPITNYQLPVTIRWQARQWMAEPLVVALKLLDKDFAVGGERVAALGNRYPNVLWVPGEVVEETYTLNLRPDTPPGLYRLELGLVRQDDTLPNGFEQLPVTNDSGVLGNNLYPLTVRVLDTGHGSPPPQPIEAQLGSSIRLAGFDVNPMFSDSPPALAVILYWESTKKITEEYTVFTQLVGPDGQVWAQWDNPPQAGRYPTTAWAATDRVVDRYRLTLRQGAPPGNYRLLVGMYRPATGERLPATIGGQPQPNNAIELITLSVTP